MATIAFIPIRSGSKSIPKKNIKQIAGKPLIFWTLLAAEKCSEIDEIHVAIDNFEFQQVIESFSFEKVRMFHRSENNARDTSTTESVILEFLVNNHFDRNDTFILIQATSPLLQFSHLEEALKQYKDSGRQSMLSCAKSKRFIWSKDGNPINYDLKNRPRRQDFDGLLVENGAFYINKVSSILESKNRLEYSISVFEMPEYSLYEIDEIDDWFIIEQLIYKYHHYFNESKYSLKNNIKLVLTDVDGVLTDAGMYYSENGDELKKFNTRDGMGFQLLREKGFQTGIITSENTLLVEKRAKKLKVNFLYQGIKDKLQTVEKLCTEIGLSLSNIAYIGDDYNDYELLKSVGYAACPIDAIDRIKNITGIEILQVKGGNGAFRELVEKIVLKCI